MRTTDRCAMAIALLLLPCAAGEGAGPPAMPEWSFTGGYTLVGLAAEDGRPESEVTASADVYLTRTGPAGRLTVYVEGNTTPGDAGVSSLLPESNADSLTAIDAGGGGRLQVSEIKYEWTFGEDAFLGFGLIDLTAYLDTTRLDNDENMQFLGTSFLNNPAIEFPDYVPGVLLHRHGSGGRPFLTLAVTGSGGLADNPDRSYSELLDLTADGKGMFLGSEAGWENEHHLLRIGAWVNTGSREPLDGRPRHEDTYGFYTNLGLSRNGHATSFRLGFSDPDVSLAAGFASLTYKHEWDGLALGLGAARTWRSDEAPGPASDISQVEAYLRVDLHHDLFLTPSLQFIGNSAYDGSDTVRPDRAYVIALRLHQRF